MNTQELVEKIELLFEEFKAEQAEYIGRALENKYTEDEGSVMCFVKVN